MKASNCWPDIRQLRREDEIWNINLAVNSECGSVVVKGQAVELGHHCLELLCHLSHSWACLQPRFVRTHLTLYIKRRDVWDVREQCVWVCVKKEWEFVKTWERLLFAQLSLGGSWFLAWMINVDWSHLKPLKMRAVHVSSSLFSSAFHSGTCCFGISFMYQSKLIFSVCPN